MGGTGKDPMRVEGESGDSPRAHRYPAGILFRKVGEFVLQSEPNAIVLTLLRRITWQALSFLGLLQ